MACHTTGTLNPSKRFVKDFIFKKVSRFGTCSFKTGVSEFRVTFCQIFGIDYVIDPTTDSI